MADSQEYAWRSNAALSAASPVLSNEGTYRQQIRFCSVVRGDTTALIFEVCLRGRRYIHCRRGATPARV